MTSAGHQTPQLQLLNWYLWDKVNTYSTTDTESSCYCMSCRPHRPACNDKGRVQQLYVLEQAGPNKHMYL